MWMRIDMDLLEETTANGIAKDFGANMIVLTGP